MTVPIVQTDLRGSKFYFYESRDIKALVDTIFHDEYGIFEKKLKFRPGDVVIDFGANEGVFSIMMAKLWPDITVYSYEPVSRTYSQLLRNIGLNGTTNIMPYQLGVGGKAGKRIINISKDYSGGSSAVIRHNPTDHIQEEIDIVTMEEACANFPHIRLIKMDIEGMEYEACYPFTRWNDVDYFAGEVHNNTLLEYDARRPDGLSNWLGQRTKITAITVCRMSE